MKKHFFHFMILSLFCTSCQKEMDWLTSGGSGNNTSNVITQDTLYLPVKIIIDAQTYDLSYKDSIGNLSSIKSSWSTLLFFYNSNNEIVKVQLKGNADSTLFSEYLITYKDNKPWKFANGYEVGRFSYYSNYTQIEGVMHPVFGDTLVRKFHYNDSTLYAYNYLNQYETGGNNNYVSDAKNYWAKDIKNKELLGQAVQFFEVLPAQKDISSASYLDNLSHNPIIISTNYVNKTYNVAGYPTYWEKESVFYEGEYVSPQPTITTHVYYRKVIN